MFDIPCDLSNHFQECPIKQALVFFSSSRYASPMPSYCLFGGIINLPPKEDYQVYAQLPCSDEDRAKIVELITTIGTKGKVDILLHYKEKLEKMGSEINEHVHPLKFMSVICSNPQLKSYMRNPIMEDFFKRTNFIHGLAKRMNVEYKKGKLLKFADDFCLEVGVRVEDVRPLLERKDCEGFVTYLIHH